MVLAMTSPGKDAKKYGVSSIKLLSRVSGVPYSTLTQWHGTRPLLFKTVCIGARVMSLDHASAIDIDNKKLVHIQVIKKLNGGSNES